MNLKVFNSVTFLRNFRVAAMPLLTTRTAACRWLFPLRSGRCHRALAHSSWRTNVRVRLSDFSRCHRALASEARALPRPASSDDPAKKTIVEKLWREFFTDPSKWWDNRSEKVNTGFPDFKHKTTNEGLWLDGRLNPRWVEAKLSAMPPGTVQSSIFSWNKRLAKLAKAGQFGKTIELFHQFQREGLNSNKFTYIPLLSACTSLRAIEEGRCFHRQIVEDGFESDLFVGSSLVHMYAKCGHIVDAEKVFNKLPKRDLIAWNSMILGLAKCGQGLKALRLSQHLQLEGLEPDSGTFVGMLNACGAVAALEEGRRVHEQIVQKQLESDVLVGSCLVDMYTKCGSIEDAWKVFNKMPTRNVFTWTAMILGYVKYGQGHKALALSKEMQGQGVEPSPVTFVGMLNACACVAAIIEGRHIHEQIKQRGLESNIFISSCLVDMYAKCGSIEDAWRVFNNMPTRDVVAWTAMIQGYVACGQGQKALELFEQMQQEGQKTDPVTFSVVLSACASTAALEEGRRIHDRIIQSGLESNMLVGSCLIDMYAKCGSILDARRIFDKLPKRNLVSWNALMGGYAMHGHVNEALVHFERMDQEGIEMDEVTFVSLMSACSHAGLVNEGLLYFESICSVHNVSATVDHYTCLIDLLGRAGRLHEAEDVITTMSCEADAPVWMSLLGACRHHGNLEMGELVGKQVLELDRGNTSAYVLLSNMYAAAGKWDRSANLQRQRLEAGPKKESGR